MWVLLSFFWFIPFGFGLLGLIIYTVLPTLGIIMMVGGFGLSIISPIMDKIETKREKEEQERRRRAEHAKQLKVEQEYIYNDMVGLVENSMNTFDSLPRYLEEAEKHLDQAQIDYQENAYSPFWSSIEKAATYLARYDEGIKQIKQYFANYSNLAKQLNTKPPNYPLSSEVFSKLETGTVTSKKMEEIVRNAQRNFEFSTIYEQRKTNQILIAGFTNLADALDNMTYHITESIDDMKSSLNQSLQNINATVQKQHSEYMSQHSEYMSQHKRAATEQANRERIILERLDNIQRNRRPVL